MSLAPSCFNSAIIFLIFFPVFTLSSQISIFLFLIFEGAEIVTLPLDVSQDKMSSNSPYSDNLSATYLPPLPIAKRLYSWYPSFTNFSYTCVKLLAILSLSKNISFMKLHHTIAPFCHSCAYKRSRGQVIGDFSTNSPQSAAKQSMHMSFCCGSSSPSSIPHFLHFIAIFFTFFHILLIF